MLNQKINARPMAEAIVSPKLIVPEYVPSSSCVHTPTHLGVCGKPSFRSDKMRQMQRCGLRYYPYGADMGNTAGPKSRQRASHQRQGSPGVAQTREHAWKERAAATKTASGVSETEDARLESGNRTESGRKRSTRVVRAEGIARPKKSKQVRRAQRRSGHILSQSGGAQRQPGRRRS